MAEPASASQATESIADSDGLARAWQRARPRKWMAPGSSVIGSTGAAVVERAMGDPSGLST